MILLTQSVQEVDPTGLERIVRYVTHLPDREQFLTDIAALGPVHALVLAAAGIACLIWGYKIFKVLVVLNAACVGWLIGYNLGASSGSANTPLWVGLSGAILFGAVAWPLLKYAVCLMGALCGGLIGFTAWTIIANSLNKPGMLDHAWAGGLVGMVLVGMLTFIVFPMTVMILTATQGALMAVIGVLSLLFLGGMGEGAKPEIKANHYLLAIIIGVPAVVGFVVQYAAEGGKAKKKPKPDAKPAS